MEPDQILDALAFYVDFSAIADVVTAHNVENPQNQIRVGEGVVDAIFAEGVHQFQMKCFLEQGQHDGKAGESTLDSLGLLRRTGLQSWNRVNQKAQGRLGSAGTEVADETGGEFTAEDWFDHMANPAVLGFTFNRGIHVVLLRKLRDAERHLLTLPPYVGMTPVELGRALGMSERHKGSRPTADSGSMHTFGLAVDIGYRANPWIRRDSSRDAIRRAALLVNGRRLSRNRITKEFHALGNDPDLSTPDIYDGVAVLDASLRQYLGFESDASALRAAIASRIERGTGNVVEPGESVADAVSRWQPQIRADRRALQRGDFDGHDPPRRGFLNLPQDLVVALREAGCLAWGGCDIGPGKFGSGDMMHFDARAEGVGRRLARTGPGGNFIPPRRQCASVAAFEAQPSGAAPGSEHGHTTSYDSDSSVGTSVSEVAVPLIDLEHAVARNRAHASTLGWDTQRQVIVHTIATRGTPMSEEQFAQAVATWQQQHEDLVVDGILGPTTWERLQQAIEE